MNPVRSPNGEITKPSLAGPSALGMILSPSNDVAKPGPTPRATPEPAFDAVYREHFRFVWRSARRMGVDGALVDDVVQDAFVIVHRRLGEFEGRSSMKTWLYGIVRRVVADQRRAVRRKPAHEPEGKPHDLGAVADCGGHEPDACAERAERIALVRSLLAELDEEKREVLILAELEGMTMAEIGEAIEVNPNTVSSRLRAARRAFELALDLRTQQRSVPQGALAESRAR